jgi:hypothetical protein
MIDIFKVSIIGKCTDPAVLLKIESEFLAEIFEEY